MYWMFTSVWKDSYEVINRFWIGHSLCWLQPWFFPHSVWPWVTNFSQMKYASWKSTQRRSAPIQMNSISTISLSKDITVNWPLYEKAYPPFRHCWDSSFSWVFNFHQSQWRVLLPHICTITVVFKYLNSLKCLLFFMYTHMETLWHTHYDCYHVYPIPKGKETEGLKCIPRTLKEEPRLTSCLF